MMREPATAGATAPANTITGPGGSGIESSKGTIGFQMNPSMEDGAKDSSPWWTSPAEWLRIIQEWRPRELEELMPDLHPDEQLRFQKQFCEREERAQTRRKKKRLPASSSNASEYLAMIESSDGCRRHETILMPLVLEALCHYNARHPGGEFDPVKPLMCCRVLFRGHEWFHINFWACSHTNRKTIKRFFAEIHKKMITTYPTRECLGPQKVREFLPIVEQCAIIEEPLCQYKRSCGFCDACYDILHPKGCRKFICGNDKDWLYQRLEWPRLCGNTLCSSSGGGKLI